MDANELKQWAESMASPIIEQGPAPAGWRTTLELAQALGYSAPQMSKLLTRAEAEGLAERRRFRTQTARGMFPAWHWKLKKPWPKKSK